MSIFNLKKRNFTILTVALTAILVLAFAGKAIGAWGPDRPTFTWAHPADHVTFNSITNNPSVGDERFFATGRVLPSNTNIDPVTGVKDGDHVKVQVYYHNNAASNLNKKAKNTRVSIALRDPNTSNTSHYLSTQISADNAKPQAVWDTVDIKGDQPFTLSYVPGSARLFNGVFTTASGGIALPDDVTSEQGTLIGYDKMDGILPGCSEFSGFVYIEVVVHSKPVVTPQYACNMLSLDVMPNRKVNALVTYTATNGATFKNATFIWGDNSTPTIVSATSASHTYSADGNYTISATLKFDVGGTEQQSSCTKSITVTTPAFACTGLNVTTGSGRTVNASVTYTVNNATFQSAKFTWGDNTTPSVVNANTASHTYNADGTYTINAQVTTNMGTTAVSDVCSKVVTFTPNQPPTVTPPATPPASLPNTGPGSVAAIFAGVASFAGMFHYLWNGRKQTDL